MIKLPNGTISRTLAEQVGFNSAKIAEIIKFLNESGLKDLVINLESDSGTLSTDQYAIAELSPSYMVYDGGVFYKVYEDSDYIDYFLLQEQVAVDSDMEVNHFRIHVERDSRNYALETVNIFTSYNKSQIDSIVSTLNSALNTKANLSGAAFTGPITSPSIIENMSGYSFTTPTSDLTIEINVVYAGVVKNGNKLTFVVVGDFTRKDTMSPGQRSIGSFTIPATIHDKLYPVKSSWLTMKQLYLANDYNAGVSKPCICNKETANSINPIVYGLSDLTLNTTYYFRYEETFLLSDNLAS